MTRPNGGNTNYGYDSVSHLLSVLHQAGANTLDGASYTYDPAGNRATKTNYLNGVTSNYGYDLLYELTQVTHGSSTTESYSYDAVGNRLSSSGVPSYSYNASNELTTNSLGSYTYDNNGNTLSDDSGKSYTWDFENRMTQAVVPGQNGGTTTFKYDPFGRRIQKSGPLGTTNYLYDGPNLLEEVDQNDSVVARYNQGKELDEVLAELRSGITSYYQQDGIGSSTSLSNSAGALTNTYAYDSFGQSTASTGTITNPFQYAGREFDAETHLLYNRARYLDTTTGRFVSEDPLSFRTGLNYYAYVGNNPALFIDPTGLVQINYRTILTHQGFWDSLWQAGGTQPHYRWHADCAKQCDGTWKVNLTLSISFDVTYSTPFNLDHELGHVYVAELFFNRNKSQFERFEKDFGSQGECQQYRGNGLNSDVQNQLQQDEPALDKEQNNYDGFWGWFFD